jgi:hypothetical protein
MSLYQHIIDKRNIYAAIYQLRSYISEMELLSEKDIELYYKLLDVFDYVEIEKVIGECQKKLERILQGDEFFEATVYFKFKKHDPSTGENEFRPIHTSDLISQICMVSMLNVLLYNDDLDAGTRKLSEIALSIPSFFYGNIPSTSPEQLFFPWRVKYKEYSSNVISAFHQYTENKKYKYAISFDLKNFFPSVNPNIIVKQFIDKYGHLFDSDEDKACFKQLLIKLMYMEVELKGNDRDAYYGKILKGGESLPSLKKHFTVGIPQGLPQSYFFGNLCMVEVYKLTKKVLDGGSKSESDYLYYVDDSTIFTANEKLKEPAFFKELINQINDSLNLFSHRYDGSACKEAEELTRVLDYTITLHKDSKSEFNAISDENVKWLVMGFVVQQTSDVASSLFTAIDDSDNDTNLSKVKAICEEIEKKIASLNEGDTAVRKLLIRYKKYFSFRLEMMYLRQKNAEEVIKETDKDILQSKPSAEELTNGIFWTKMLYYIQNLKWRPEKRNSLVQMVRNVEHSLCTKPLFHLYYSRHLDNLKTLEEAYSKSNLYRSLRLLMLQYLPDYSSANTRYLKEEIKPIYIRIVKGFLDTVGYKMVSFVYELSNAYKREIANAAYSHLFSIELAGNVNNVTRKRNMSLNYSEFRMLVFLRNPDSDMRTFKQFLDKVIAEDGKDMYMKVDTSLLRVIPVISSRVMNPDQIDKLIKLHQYVSGLWNNGTKFLYFYTLHNEEHSVELIFQSLKLEKYLNFLSLKSTDYFYLFSACYLHDISMVIYPDVYSFVSDDKEEMQYCTNLRKELLTWDKKDYTLLKNIILDNYKEVDGYFESHIRSQHPWQSAELIKKQSGLNEMLNNADRQIVADISQAHG